MIKKKKLVVIIPVRKNSSGIKNKNLIVLNNKTLLERTIILSKKNNFIDKTIVSTDCKKMYSIAKKYKSNSISLRPKKLSTKYALTIDVIKHEIKKNKLKDCFILLLQVTSPFRSMSLTNEYLKKFEKNKNFKSAASVTFFDHPHPFKVQIIKNKKLISLMNKESMVPRQKLKKVLKLNGMFYIAHTCDIIKNKSFFTKTTMPFLIHEDYSLNLDNEIDLILLRHLKKKLIKNDYKSIYKKNIKI